MKHSELLMKVLLPMILPWEVCKKHSINQSLMLLVVVNNNNNNKLRFLVTLVSMNSWLLTTVLSSSLTQMLAFLKVLLTKTSLVTTMESKLLQRLLLSGNSQSLYRHLMMTDQLDPFSNSLRTFCQMQHTLIKLEWLVLLTSSTWDKR